VYGIQLLSLQTNICHTEDPNRKLDIIPYLRWIPQEFIRMNVLSRRCRNLEVLASNGIFSFKRSFGDAVAAGYSYTIQKVDQVSRKQ
jgi:hypothetical protein